MWMRYTNRRESKEAIGLMQGFRRSGHVYDDAECQISIAEFMAYTQERHNVVG